MAEKESILERARRQGLATPNAGMDVPPGYFADFARNMAAKLPYRAEAEAPDSVPQAEGSSLWRRVRPYVYLAAMFAGIWLMLQMFAMMGSHGELKPVDENPVLAEAFSDDEFMLDYFYDDMDSYELYDDIINDPYCENDVEPVPDAFEAPENVVLPDSSL